MHEVTLRSFFFRRRGRAGFSLIELMIVVAIMGVLAAIAIPSLQKSVRRSRTSEALMGLRKIFDGSVVYFEREHTTANGLVVSARFPVTVTLTPGLPPTGMKADPVPTSWENATWEALDFAVTDPYYYVYQYESAGTTEDAWFWGEAIGDLDGDGHYSLFRRGGSIRGAEVRGFGGVYRLNELD
jgi:prepilin-type N-terminal cleavage/methylation domain-containing protein